MAHIKQDLAIIVGVVGQFIHDSRVRHMRAVDKILQYLKSRPHLENDCYLKSVKVYQRKFTLILTMLILLLAEDQYQDIVFFCEEIW